MNNSINTAPTRYTSTAIALHWAVALGIFAALAMGLIMTELAVSPLRLKMYNWHKWVGVTVLALAVIRSLWRMTHPVPAPLPMPAWQLKLAHIIHGVLYLAMFVLPITGWLFSNAKGYPVVYLGMLPLPDLVAKNEALADALHEVHEACGWVLMAVIALHALGALKHHFIERDRTLMRMIKGA